MSDYATYSDVYGPGGMADDRDDSNDPEFRDYGGYCGHGRYVGGSGPDLMCEWCEAGISPAEARAIVARERLAGVRERAEGAARLLAALLMHGMSGIDAARFAQESSHVGNPRARYGRH
jgi:hypothetical protein